MTSSSSSDTFRNVTKYTGQDYRFVPTYIRPRDPLSPTLASKDTKPKEQQGYYPITSLWTNSANGNIWALSGITNNLAKWVLLSGGSSGPLLNIPVPLGTSPVVPSGSGSLAFTSLAGTINITGGLNTINFDLIGGSVGVDSIQVQQVTPPGVNPVIPTVAGLLIFNGAAVAAHSVPIETRSRALNTMNVEVQISSDNATSDSTKNGLAHFNTRDFTVDANGFVSSKGGLDVWVRISANQTLAVQTGYFCVSPGGALALALPATAASTIGDIIEVTLDGATSFTITQAAGQQIRYNNLQTTLGPGGSIATTDQGNSIKLVYQITGRWNIVSALGTLVVT